MHRTELTLSYPSVAAARQVTAAIEPEVGEIASERSTVELARDGAMLTISLQASDPVALRAGLNTWLGFVEVSEDVTSVAERFEQNN